MNWQPTSDCSAACRPGADARVSGLTKTVRLVSAAAIILAGLVLIPLGGEVAAQRVCRWILAALGVRLRSFGKPPRPGTLVVANHVSWLDIVAMIAVSAPITLVAKGEVQRWPGIGALATVLGVVFLDRGRPKSLPDTVASVSAQLRTGRSVQVFPEGTTYCGGSVAEAGQQAVHRGGFRPAFFQAAVDAGAPVLPMLISYDSTAAAFIGDDTLWASVCRVAAVRRVTVTMVAAPVLRPDAGADRRALARAAYASISVPTASLGLAA